MIKEFAVDPAYAATWHKRQVGRFFLHMFGLGEGRFISRYPKKWRRHVWNSFKESDELARKRLEELLIRLGESTIERPRCHWDPTACDWLENALKENEQFPFAAILTELKKSNSPFVLSDEEISDDNEMWRINKGVSVKRTAEDMSKTIAPLLSLSRFIKFIDPYMSPTKVSHRNALKEFFNILSTINLKGSNFEIEIHVFEERSPSVDHWMKNRSLFLPKDMVATLYIWKEKEGGQKFHNRYILTNLAGVSFQHGLGEGNKGETDDVTLLDYEQYILRWSQYSKDTNAFNLAEGPLLLKGA